jgi:hypothetical protein
MQQLDVSWGWHRCSIDAMEITGLLSDNEIGSEGDMVVAIVAAVVGEDSGCGSLTRKLRAGWRTVR